MAWRRAGSDRPAPTSCASAMRLVHLGHELVEVQRAASGGRSSSRRTGPSAWSCRGRPRRRCSAPWARARCPGAAPRDPRDAAPAPQAPRQLVEAGGHLRLRGVGFDHAVGDERPIRSRGGSSAPRLARRAAAVKQGPRQHLSALELCPCRMQRPASCARPQRYRGPSPHVAMQHHIYVHCSVTIICNHTSGQYQPGLCNAIADAQMEVGRARQRGQPTLQMRQSTERADHERTASRRRASFASCGRRKRTSSATTSCGSTRTAGACALPIPSPTPSSRTTRAAWASSAASSTATSSTARCAAPPSCAASAIPGARRRRPPSRSRRPTRTRASAPS